MSQPGKSTVRNAVLWGGLVLSVGASIYTYFQDLRGQGDESISEPLVREQKVTQSNKDAAPEHVAVGQPPESAMGANKDVKTKVLLDPFAPLAVALPPPPAPVVPVVAPAPTAPALPFLYAGKFEQPLSKNSTKTGANGTAQDAKIPATQTVVYLTRGNDSYAVSPGEAIDANYRFVGIEGDTLVFMYLPLSTRQTLPISP